MCLVLKLKNELENEKLVEFNNVVLRSEITIRKF